MSSYILKLDEPETVSAASAGLLAHDMALLRAANIPVPPAFCVSSVAYQDRFEALGLAGRDQELWQMNPDDTELSDRVNQAADLLRERGMDERLRSVILAAADWLGSPLINISLSPVVASYDAAAIAGLIWSANFIPPDSAPDGAAEAWAALWTMRALTFRKRVGIEHGSSTPWGAAVLVTAADPAPLQGIVRYVGKNSDDDTEAWLISADPRVRGKHDLSDEQAGEGEPKSPLTAGQAEALRILAEGAAEALGEPRNLSWTFDGSRFTITGLPYG